MGFFSHDVKGNCPFTEIHIVCMSVANNVIQKSFMYFHDCCTDLVKHFNAEKGLKCGIST